MTAPTAKPIKSEISSPWTFFLKFILPVPFAAFALDVVYTVWLGRAPFTNAAVPLAQIKYLSLAFSLSFIAIPIMAFGRLKRLGVENGHLYISNYFKEITIPISEIKDVEDHIDARLRPTMIRFSETTAFGRTIEFVPKDRLLPWQRSAIVADLRKLANLADLS